MTSLLRFSLLLLLVSVVFLAIVWWVQHAFHLFTSSPFIITGGLIFYYFLFVFVYAVSAYGLKKNQQTFTTMTFGGIGIKFFFSIGFILVNLLFAPVVDKAFILLLVILYLFYSVFEIYFLLTNLRHISNKK